MAPITARLIQFVVYIFSPYVSIVIRSGLIQHFAAEHSRAFNPQTMQPASSEATTVCNDSAKRGVPTRVLLRTHHRSDERRGLVVAQRR
jgi:hypothetical protein